MIRLGGRARHALHLYWRFQRGMTLGVRAAVIAPDDRVCLVRHTYLDGWYLPGGGVEPGESVHDSLARELLEEANVTITGPVRLHGLFLNAPFMRDHVALFVVRDFTVSGPRAPDREIAELGFFPLGDLPDGTTPATRRRLDEIAGDRSPDVRW